MTFIYYFLLGSTAAPPSAAICLRAGWTLGNVQDRYIKYERAGDMYVGRMVSGLPVGSSKFRILPPHFQDPNCADVEEGLNQCFSKYPAHLKTLLTFVLASVIYHQDFMRSSLPNDQ